MLPPQANQQCFFSCKNVMLQKTAPYMQLETSKRKPMSSERIKTSCAKCTQVGQKKKKCFLSTLISVFACCARRQHLQRVVVIFCTSLVELKTYKSESHYAQRQDNASKEAQRIKAPLG